MKHCHSLFCLFLMLFICMVMPASAEDTVCTVCGQAAGEMTAAAVTENGHVLTCQCNTEHTVPHSWSAWSTQEDGTHIRSCVYGCTDSEACSGGTATCSQPAVCSICGGTYGSVSPDNHSWDAGTVTKASTCKTLGIITYTCAHDSSHTCTEELPVDPDAHFFRDGVVVEPATCSHEGIVSYTCLYSASHIVEETIPVNADAHRWDSGIIVRAANCVETGEILYTCLDDPWHTRTDYIPVDLSTHLWEQRVVTLEPTCTLTGEITLICALDKNHTGTESIAPLGHKWSISTVTKQPSCEKPGILTYTCANDPSHTKEEVIPATGHFWGNVQVISEPTCTTEGSKSYICGYDIDHKTIVRVAIDPNAHNYVATEEIVSVPGICQDGEACVLKCTYCGGTTLEILAEPKNHEYSGWALTHDNHHTAVCSFCGEAEISLLCHDTKHQPCPICRDSNTQLNSVYAVSAEGSEDNVSYTIGASAGNALMHLSMYTEENGAFTHAVPDGYTTIYLNASQIASILQPGIDAYSRRAIDILHSENCRILRSDDFVMIRNNDDALLLRLYVHFDDGESDELFCKIDSGVISFKLRAKDMDHNQQTIRFVLEEK